MRGDGLPTWLYSDETGDGVATAAESMKADDVMQAASGTATSSARSPLWCGDTRICATI